MPIPYCNFIFEGATNTKLVEHKIFHQYYKRYYERFLDYLVSFSLHCIDSVKKVQQELKNYLSLLQSSIILMYHQLPTPRQNYSAQNNHAMRQSLGRRI